MRRAATATTTLLLTAAISGGAPSVPPAAAAPFADGGRDPGSVLTVAAPTDDRRAAVDVLRIDFDDLDEPDGDPVHRVSVEGVAEVTGDIVGRQGGELRAAPARSGHGRSIRLPAFDGRQTGPRAMIRVVPAAGDDWLSPDTRDFSFGASFVLDSHSSQPRTYDNGDNLVQRGLYDHPAQYKLELDARRPSCRLKGEIDGRPAEVTVRSPVRVDSTSWYSAHCVRTGDRLEVVVEKFHADGTSTTTTTRARSAGVITVQMDRGVPLSVGGKLDNDGSINVDPDQFNGLLDDVIFQVRARR